MFNSNQVKHEDEKSNFITSDFIKGIVFDYSFSNLTKAMQVKKDHLIYISSKQKNIKIN